MDIGKDLQDAYERGRQDAWDIAQKVFDSTVTLYEAEDVAKQIAKGESQNHSGEATEMVKPQYHAEIECNYKDCENCGHKNYCPQSKDEPQKLNCRNKEYYSSCEYANKCHPIVCFKAFDELKERLKEKSSTEGSE